jgi:hypothetical protein
VNDDRLPESAPERVTGERHEINAEHDSPHAEHSQAVDSGIVGGGFFAKAPDDHAGHDERDTAVDHADAGQGKTGSVPDTNGSVWRRREM